MNLQDARFQKIMSNVVTQKNKTLDQEELSYVIPYIIAFNRMDGTKEWKTLTKLLKGRPIHAPSDISLEVYKSIANKETAVVAVFDKMVRNFTTNLTEDMEENLDEAVRETVRGMRTI